MRNTLNRADSTSIHQQIEIIDTPADRFCTEIVARALNLASRGKRILIVQLLKGGIRQGHDRAINLAQNLDWIRCNSARNIVSADLDDLELQSFQQLWKYVRNVARHPLASDRSSNTYDSIVLDDLSLAIDLGLIDLKAAIDFLTTLPENLNVVLTGTNPHPALVELAD